MREDRPGSLMRWLGLIRALAGVCPRVLLLVCILSIMGDSGRAQQYCGKVYRMAHKSFGARLALMMRVCCDWRIPISQLYLCGGRDSRYMSPWRTIIGVKGEILYGRIISFPIREVVYHTIWMGRGCLSKIGQI